MTLDNSKIACLVEGVGNLTARACSSGSRHARAIAIWASLEERFLVDWLQSTGRPTTTMPRTSGTGRCWFLGQIVVQEDVVSGQLGGDSGPRFYELGSDNDNGALVSETRHERGQFVHEGAIRDGQFAIFWIEKVILEIDQQQGFPDLYTRTSRNRT
jgi:hypothetical protein